jgi:hypothetical protein
MRSQVRAIDADALDRRIRDYHDVCTDDVLEAIRYLRDGGDSVVAGGSLAFGLGNRLSDLDVVVAGSQTVDSTRVPLEHFVGSLRVDVWKLDMEVIDEEFERAERALESDAPLSGAFGNVDNETNLKLLHRIAFGVTLDGPPVEPRCGRDPRDVARLLVAREYFERLRGSALVAQLAAAHAEPLMAVLAARVAVEEAINLIIAARGLPFSGDKWLTERLAHDAPDLTPAYEGFQSVPTTPDAAAAFVGDAIATCERLAGAELTISVLAAGAEWVTPAVGVRGIGARHVLLAPAVDAVWELDADEAAAWATLEEASLGTEAVERRWPVAALGGAQTALALKLNQHGLAELRWSRGVPIGELPLSEKAAP